MTTATTVKHTSNTIAWPRDYGSGAWEQDFRSVYQLHIAGEHRGWIVLPHGFGKAWMLLTLTDGPAKHRVRKASSRHARSAEDRRAPEADDPIRELLLWAAERPSLFLTRAEEKAAKAEAKAAEEAAEAKCAAERQARVDEGIALTIGLYRLAKRLEAHRSFGFEVAELLRGAARELPGAFPPGIRNAVTALLIADQNEEIA